MFSIYIRKISSTVAAILTIFVIGMSVANAYSLPGIAPSGAPNLTFEKINFSAKNFNNGGISLWASSSERFDWNINGQTYQGTKGSFNLTSEFTDSGTFIGGTVSVFGKITDWGIDSPQFLMSADLSSFTFSGDLLGWDTDNIVCDPALWTGCTLQESVYIDLDKLFPGLGALTQKNWKSGVCRSPPYPYRLRPGYLVQRWCWWAGCDAGSADARLQDQVNTRRQRRVFSVRRLPDLHPFARRQEHRVIGLDIKRAVKLRHVSQHADDAITGR
jgi:hypothetical protein